MEHSSSTDIEPRQGIHDEVMNINQSVTSSPGQSALQTQPKTLMSLPRELRDRIYEFSFYCEPSLVVFAVKTRPSDYGGPENPETAQVMSQHEVFYPGSFATFGGHIISNYVSKTDPGDFSQETILYPSHIVRGGMHQKDPLVASRNTSTTTATTSVYIGANWSKLITGILYANKQVSSEAAPFLYRSCSFLFQDFDLSQKFLEIVQPTNLESIRRISIHYPDELEFGYTLYRTFAHNRAAMRQKFHLLCEQIVKKMPKVKELTVWIGAILELEYGGTRCEVYEQAILEFAALKELETITVRKYGPVFDNSDVEYCWEDTNEYTVGGVTEMIERGDPTALDRWQKAFDDGVSE